MNKNTKRKDWVGGPAAVFKTLGASNHTCAEQMQKHQPFGWVKDKKDGHHALITAVDDDTCGMSLNGNAAWSLSGIMDLFNFSDGVPFGVKIEDDYNGIK